MDEAIVWGFAGSLWSCVGSRFISAGSGSTTGGERCDGGSLGAGVAGDWGY
jgi:hypothetical protein